MPPLRESIFLKSFGIQEIQETRQEALLLARLCGEIKKKIILNLSCEGLVYEDLIGSVREGPNNQDVLLTRAV